MIQLLALATVTRLRFDMPTISDGEAVQAAPVRTEIRASVQPLTGQALQWLVEGQATSSAIEMITYAEVRAASELAQVPADHVELADGRVFEVVTADKMPPFLGQPAHWEASALEVAP